MNKLLRSVWTIFWVLIFTLIYGSLAVIGGIFERHGKFIHLCAKYWARSIFWVCGVRYSVHGLENLDVNRPYVIMANHQSAIDIPLMFLTIPIEIRMIAKKELFRIPVLGWALNLGGYVNVDRSDTENAVASLKRAANKLADDRISLVVFPEGTRSETGELGEFKKGGFMFALQTGFSVLPVAIQGTRELTPKNKLYIRPGTVEVYIQPPLHPAAYGIDTRKEFMDHTKQLIASKL